MSVNSEQALQNGLSHRHEVLPKGNTWTEHMIFLFICTLWHIWFVVLLFISFRVYATSWGCVVTGTYFWRKQSLVVQLVLNPRHQIINVLWSRALNRLLNVGPVRPMILVSKHKEMRGVRKNRDEYCHTVKTHSLGSGRHDWAAALRAEVCDGAIQHVYLVEEIHRCGNNHTQKNLTFVLKCVQIFSELETLSAVHKYHI